MSSSNIRISHVPVSETPIQDILINRDNCAPYLMSFGFDLGPLKESIQTVGLINPPLLRRNEKGELEVVLGYKRILAMAELNRNTVASRILSHEDMEPRDALLMALYDNLATRLFNPMEKALILTRLGNHFSDKELCDRFMPLLGLPRHVELYRFYLEMEKDFSNPIKEAVAKGQLQLKSARLLLGLDVESREYLFEFTKKLMFNINQRHQLIDIVIDLANIGGRSIKELLKDPEVMALVNDPRRNMPQKSRAILALLRAKRFPRLTHVENQIRKKIASLDLPDGVKIGIPPYLEGSEYTLEVSFKDGKSLFEKLKDIMDNSNLENFQSLLAEAGTWSE
ncbi:MAG: hypothetical protein DRG63_02120 [Deltaproteobacteria bacterium]|nr:MAG: hypothetical protein DRG63_02120 [Deltaproteobacteria bacterium]